MAVSVIGGGATPSRSILEYYAGNILAAKTGDLNDDYVVSIPESISNLALEKTSVRTEPSWFCTNCDVWCDHWKSGNPNISCNNQSSFAVPVYLLKIFNEYLFYF